MPETTNHEDLWRLAAAYDVVPGYRGHDGHDHEPSDETAVRVLAALGVDASSPERVALALANVEHMPFPRTDRARVRQPRERARPGAQGPRARDRSRDGAERVEAEVARLAVADGVGESGPDRGTGLGVIAAERISHG